MTEDNTIALDTYRAEELCDDLGVLEDWLLHCGTGTLDELADFAFHASHQPPLAVTELITALGHHGSTLRRLLRARTDQH